MSARSGHRGASRRSLLKLGAGAGATALLGPRDAVAQAAPGAPAATPAHAVMTRPDINSAAGARMVGLYTTAVGKMQDPAINIPPQPQSWTFQAYTHGVPDDPFHPMEAGALLHGTPELAARINLIYGNPAPGSPHAAWKAAALACWGTCPHGSPWFVAWHRWYVFYFEKIVRKFSGAADFALPYWNYASDQGTSLQLPAAFQQPTDQQGNIIPIYEDLRGLGFANPAGSGAQNVPMNQDGYMPFSQTDYNPALSAINLFPSDDTYVAPPDPAYYAFGLAGRLEVQPHDDVHVNVGGLMSNVPVAAGDPIFFVHHCQIDRLWASWQSYSDSVYNWGSTPTDPSEAAWKGRKFDFVDENGKVVNVTTGGQMSTKDMGYVYDSLPPRPSAPVVVAAAIAPAAPVQVAAAQANGLTVGSGGARVTLSPAPTPPAAAAPQAAAPGAQTLVLDNVRLVARPPAPLHVFLNLPEGAPATLDSPYYVGTLNFFKWSTKTGKPMLDTAEGHTMAGTGQFRFTVGPVLARQKARNLWNGGPLTVTVTTFGADRSSGRTYVTIGEVKLVP
jgi:tyrosinase